MHYAYECIKTHMHMYTYTSNIFQVLASTQNKHAQKCGKNKGIKAKKRVSCKK